jgi:hypothetical protein
MYTCIAIHSFIQESISDIPNVVITYSLLPNVFEEKWLLLSKSCRSKTGIANKHHKEATFNAIAHPTVVVSSQMTLGKIN